MTEDDDFNEAYNKIRADFNELAKKWVSELSDKIANGGLDEPVLYVSNKVYDKLKGR